MVWVLVGIVRTFHSIGLEIIRKARTSVPDIRLIEDEARRSLVYDIHHELLANDVEYRKMVLTYLKAYDENSNEQEDRSSPEV